MREGAPNAPLNQTEESRYRLLVEAVTDYAIYMLDPTGHVVSWNPGAQRIKGYAIEEILGQHFSRFYTEEDRKSGEPEKALKTAMTEGRFAKESWRLRKDGTRFWASIVIDPIRDQQGNLIGFGKVTRDITEQKKAREELELAREALFQSQKMETVGQLTGGIAHDFNNLLMAILGSLELLKKRLPDDPRARSLLDNAAQGAERGRALTQRMLAFARRQALKPVAIDVPALLQGMTDLLHRSLGAGVSIEMRFPARVAHALADTNQLELAVLNLAMNARDAMPEGGTITIRAREDVIGPGAPATLGGKLKPGGYVVLSVIDTGEGMDSETLARAMEPFFTTKGVGKGTGLGLSMVHGMAEQSGGALILDSTPDKGTSAEIWLPPAEDGAIPERLSPQEAQNPATDVGRALTVLAVDDDGLVLMNTAAMLEDLGHIAFEAMSGEEALQILAREKNIDLVITDQGMPRMTGVQLVQALRVTHPDLPVIVATGYAELPPEADKKLPKLDKPFNQSDLAEAIAAAMLHA